MESVRSQFFRSCQLPRSWAEDCISYHATWLGRLAAGGLWRVVTQPAGPRSEKRNAQCMTLDDAV